MDRKTVTTLARAHGGRIVVSGKDFTAFQFPSAQKVEEFRDKIPYTSLWGGDGVNNVPPLQVYFDEVREPDFLAPTADEVRVNLGL